MAFFFFIPDVPGIQSTPYMGWSTGVKGKKNDPVTQGVKRRLIQCSLGLC